MSPRTAPPGAGSARLVDVALPLPVASPYTYRVPDALAERVRLGARVVVPVRRRELIGIVVGDDAEPPKAAPRDILGAPDSEPAVPEALLATARWVAEYYGAPLGLTLKAVLPAGLWGSSLVIAKLSGDPRGGGGDSEGGTGPGSDLVRWLQRRGGEGSIASAQRALRRPLWDTADRLARAGVISLEVEPPDTGGAGASERIVTLPSERLTLLERDEVFRRAPRRRELYEALESLGGSAPARHLAEQLGFGGALVRALVGQGLATVGRTERMRDPFADAPSTPPPGPLTAAQRAALDAIEATAPGHAALLYGVTGSGKTLVYLEEVRRMLQAGRSAIVLVPEIGLTPQTVSRFRGMFGDEVAVLHSGLSDGERADAWRMLRRGERRVAVGARSAVFAPVADLGLIVVDEEHESSYKNGETPRYHARAVAQVRARLEGARLLLGSATPALETMAAVGERLQVVRLPARIAARPMPPVELVDLRHAPRVREAAPVAWSEALDRAVVESLARHEQVLLLLNRRGFASFLQCQDCGDVRQCPNCTISLTVHHAPAGLRCHYCGHHAPLPLTCVACAGLEQEMRGVGTQQLEEVLAARFPDARIARMDLDTTSTKWAHQRILGAVETGEVDLLIGTQMIAKGLDFPNVTLVGVVDADVGLHLPDFRSAERTFQLLAQVAGRAGRGPKGGRVLVQTRNPEHHALVHAAAHDTDAFIAAEMAGRRSPPYPPETSLLNLVVSGEDEGAVGRGAAALADWCNRLLDRHSLPLVVLGPAPCPLARVKTRWRWHVALKGPGPAIGRVVRYAAPRLRPRRDLRITMDRDPVSMM